VFEMKNCLTCGARLSATLVDAVVDVKRIESCPKSKKVLLTHPSEKTESTLPPITTLMLLGSMFDEEERN
jgi:hypothetical protein